MNDFLFVNITGKMIDNYKHDAHTRYSQFKEFSANDICVCHTSIVDALRKCNNNGYIFVYDKYGNFIETIFLLRPDAFERILVYLDCDEHTRRKYEMEWALTDNQSIKGLIRSRYNPKTKVDNFVVMIDVKTHVTHLEFTKSKCVITR